MSSFELMSSKDLAFQMTQYDWELFSCVHEVNIPAGKLIHKNTVLKTTLCIDPACVFAVRAGVSHIQPSSIQALHGQFGAVSEALQSGSVVGGDGGLSVCNAQQTRSTAQEVHQDRRPVSSPMHKLNTIRAEYGSM